MTSESASLSMRRRCPSHASVSLFLASLGLPSMWCSLSKRGTLALPLGRCPCPLQRMQVPGIGAMVQGEWGGEGTAWGAGTVQIVHSTVGNNLHFIEVQGQ